MRRKRYCRLCGIKEERDNLVTITRDRQQIRVCINCRSQLV